MGLAIVTQWGPHDGTVQFKMDLGANRYWTYAVGDEETAKEYGIELLQNTKYVSPVMGPLPVRSMGRGTFDVPSSLFDRANCCLQLRSFRTRDGVGPAISDIQRIPHADRAPEDLPTVALGKE
jgi:hypothetical protein